MNRQKLDQILDVKESLEGIVEVEVTIYPSGRLRVWASPPSYYEKLTEEQRHKVIAALTPLTGKMEVELHERDKWWKGETKDVNVTFYRADECKIIGYRKVKKTVKKEVIIKEAEIEYETVEEEVDEPITDCDVRTGKSMEDDIEVQP